jgi:hypothetical protein
VLLPRPRAVRPFASEKALGDGDAVLTATGAVLNSVVGASPAFANDADMAAGTTAAETMYQSLVVLLWDPVKAGIDRERFERVGRLLWPRFE